MTALTPRDLLDLFETGLKPRDVVAVDTETSGLYPDDGARISTVSVAWPDPDSEWLDFASETKEVSWAIEEIAPGEFVPIVSMAWPFDQGVAGKEEDNGQGMLWAEAENLDREQWDALLIWLRKVGDDVGLSWHNALFDLLMFLAGCRRWPGRGVNLIDQTVWDTQNANHLLWPLIPDPDKGGHPTTSLKPTSRHLFGADVADEAKVVQRYLKKKRLPAGRWDLMPWDVIGSYADKDARLTVMLRLHQEWAIYHKGAGNWLVPKDFEAKDENDEVTRIKFVYEALQRRLDTMKLLTRMEIRALPYDEVGSRLAGDECLKRADALAQDLPFTPTPDNAKDFFFGDGLSDRGVERLGLPAYTLTEKGNVSLTAEVLDRMVNDGVPFAKQYSEYTKVVNAASMWYNGYADRVGPDGRLRCRYRQNGTVSTRFSVERVNLQAIPQDFRLSSHSVLDGIPTPRTFIGNAVDAMPGWRLWELDLAQAELRVAADFAGCTTMLEMIKADTDLHGYTTEELFKIKPDHKDWFKMRQIGKRGNFSLCFGSGGDTFMKMIRKETGIDLGDALANKIVRDWNRLYPEFSRAIDKHMDVVTRRQVKHKKGWIDLLNGERRWFQQYEDAHKAFNQRVQGNLAQFGIDWMLQSDNILRSHGLDEHNAGLLLTIHDSQVILAPDSPEGEAMVQQCKEAGLRLWKQMFPNVPGDIDVKEWGHK